jgi:hypothetical protein
VADALTVAPDFVHPIHAAAGCTVDSTVLFMCGGMPSFYASALASNRTWQFDTRLGLWTELSATLARHRFGHACVVLDGVVYALGGRGAYRGDFVNDTEAYDLRAARWHREPNMSMPRAHVFHSAAVIQ